MSISKNVRESYSHFLYTFKHYIAFLKVEKSITGKITHWHHDWDKLFMYLFVPWLGTKRIHNIHRKYQKHHLKHAGICKDISKVDLHEAVIDWECARFTKPDKPMNAQETMEQYFSEYSEYIIPILKKYNIYDNR